MEAQVSSTHAAGERFLPTPTWPHRLLILALTVAALGSVRTAGAQQKTLSGRWSASAMQVAWAQGDWGPACGPRPGGGGAPAGVVTITQQGGELSISGAGRSYSTSQCWEQFPGLSRASHSGGARGWRTVCKTAAGDPRQATVITTVTASDAYITFDETGQYQFVIQQQNCTASVRRSRSFRLIQREGEPPPSPATPPPATTATTPSSPGTAAPPRTEPDPASVPASPGGRCENLGPPARLEVRPARKLLRPGEEFSFRTLVLDRRGCRLPSVSPVWRLADPGAPAKLLAPGSVRVDDNAPESEIELSVSIGERAVRVVVEVASRERYEALLRQGGFNEAGESSEAAVAVIASESVGARSAVAEDRARTRRRIFAAIVGALALLFGGVGLLVVQSTRRRKRQEARRRAIAQEIAQSLPPPPLSYPPPPTQPVAAYCPTCRQEYPPNEIYCPNDGNRLVPTSQPPPQGGPTGGICPVCGQGFNPGYATCPEHGEELIPAALYRAQTAPEPRPTKKICPVCGAQYEGEAQFCGTDGATLVPIN